MNYSEHCLLLCAESVELRGGLNDTSSCSRLELFRCCFF